MPNPMSLYPDQPTGHQPTDYQSTEHHRRTYRPAAQDPPADGVGPAELDSTGRPLALRLPEWDLVPPTEFLQRHPDR